MLELSGPAEAERLSRLLFENAHDAILLTDLDGRIYDANPDETGDGKTRAAMIVRELTDVERLEGLDRTYRSLFMSAYDGVAVFALDGEILDLNDAAVALLARPREALVGAVFQEFVAPGEVDRLEALQAGRLAGESGGRRYETVLLAGDGEHIPVEITSAALLERGMPAGIACVIRDLRERVRAEERHAHVEADLRHAEKLKSLGVLAGGIAHDFNNLLLAVLGHASLAREQLPPDSPAFESLAGIEVGARRAADLATQMLAYAGQTEVNVRPLDLNALVSELSEFLRASVPRRIELDIELADDLPSVTADPAQLRQVLLNLITNAADAIGDGTGTITVTTRLRTVAEGNARTSALGEDIDAGDYVELRVDDTGCGMDVDIQQRIFDPFFTTKQTGRGLGLAATIGIVRSHGGALELLSAPGKGASFTLLLPAGTVAAVTGPAGEPAAAAGEGVVLVIDDEDLVRGVVTRMLEHFGYQTLTASDGAEGAAVVAGDPTVTAVVLDLTMPGSSGMEALETIRSLRPDLPVLLMSGYTEAPRPDLDNVEFLAKPFTTDDLVNRVQAMSHAGHADRRHPFGRGA